MGTPSRTAVGRNADVRVGRELTGLIASLAALALLVPLAALAPGAVIIGGVGVAALVQIRKHRHPVETRGVQHVR